MNAQIPPAIRPTTIATITWMPGGSETAKPHISGRTGRHEDDSGTTDIEDAGSEADRDAEAGGDKRHRETDAAP